MALPFLSLSLALMVGDLSAASLTVVHTNDLHSHILGFPPNLSYTPRNLGNDPTQGGWARMATVLSRIREERDHPVLAVDAGDFLMGSLFHTLSREQAFELRLLHDMGFDGVALGNHEFDLKPAGLARILRSAEAADALPPMLLANIRFDDDDPADDTLAAAFEEGLVQPWQVVERGGIRIGMFGLMGHDAAEVAPFARPVTFTDPVLTARTIVEELRERQSADVVIALSHSGLWSDPERSEDEVLAREVPGIDLVVSGHTHTALSEPRRVGDTWIVQTGEYGRAVGVAEIEVDPGGNRLVSWERVVLDDTIEGDPALVERTAEFESLVDEHFLSTQALTFREILAESAFPLTLDTDECPLGNLVTDAALWSARRHVADPAQRVEVAFNANGVIRDHIVPTGTGAIAVCDAFRAVPLGIGLDDEIGYPLVAFHVTAAELKRAFEVLTTVYPMKGETYYLQFAGARVAYNPYRLPFDRVTDLWLGSESEGWEPLDVHSDRLVYVTADLYIASFLGLIGDFTWGLLEIVPKDASGEPLENLDDAILDANPYTPGVQELKEWEAVLDYLAHFPDTDADGIPDVPDRYAEPQGRQQVQPSLHPLDLVRNGRWFTWLTAALLATILLALTTLLNRLFGRYRDVS